MASMIPPQTPEQKKRHDELLKSIATAKARYEAMTPEQQREERRAQRKSWVIGNMMLDNTDMTREHAEAIFDKIEDER